MTTPTDQQTTEQRSALGLEVDTATRESLEDHTLRFAPRSFRTWSSGVVAISALGGIEAGQSCSRTVRAPPCGRSGSATT